MKLHAKPRLTSRESGIGQLADAQLYIVPLLERLAPRSQAYVIRPGSANPRGTPIL